MYPFLNNEIMFQNDTLTVNDIYGVALHLKD